MDDFVSRYGQKFQPMSEGTNDIIKKQGNIEGFAWMAVTGTIQCEKCFKYIVSWTHVLRLWVRSSRNQRRSREQILRNVIQNFDLLTTAAFRIRKGLPRGSRHGASREAQEHGKAKEALKSAEKKGYINILDRCGKDAKLSGRITERGLNEDDIRRRDEEDNLDRVNFSNATEKQRWKNTYVLTNLRRC